MGLRRALAVGRAASCAAAVALVAGSAQAVSIQFDYRFDNRGFFTDLSSGEPLAERRALLDLAALPFAGFGDSLAAIAPQSGDEWSVSFTHPSLGGQAAPTVTNLEVAADTLTVFVGGSVSGPGVLGFATTGFDLTVTGSSAFVDSVLTRGQPNAIGANATDYGTWGGTIWFNARNDWYFGADAAGLTPGRPDFLTTATHELAHILGVGSADSWLAQVDAQGRFVGQQSVEAHGGPVPLEAIGAHWARGTSSFVAGQAQQTLMDPGTIPGQREYPTDLDYAGLADIGWQVSAVPEAGSATSMLAGLAGMFCAIRHNTPLGSRKAKSRIPQGRS